MILRIIALLSVLLLLSCTQAYSYEPTPIKPVPREAFRPVIIPQWTPSLVPATLPPKVEPLAPKKVGDAVAKPKPKTGQSTSKPAKISGSVRKGWASFYDNSMGKYGAVHSWRWHDKPYKVEVCRQDNPKKCVTVTVIDFCACGPRHGDPTIIDLSPGAMKVLAPNYQIIGILKVTARGIKK